MWNELLGLDLPRTAHVFRIPVYFLLGRADYNAPWQVGRDYFDRIEAPRKALVMFERSGHFIPFEEPVKFNAFMHGLPAQE